LYVLDLGSLITLVTKSSSTFGCARMQTDPAVLAGAIRLSEEAGKLR
jgi:hypothetical protein